MSRKISELDKAELLRLQAAVAKMENDVYFAGGATGDEVGKLRRDIQSSKSQMDSIEVEWRQKDQEAEAKDREQLMFCTIVAKETALNPQERQEYGDFLKETYFTRLDFDHLAHFYSHSWDKLTEGGKEQMSHRVWEGVRHGEYKFDELPDAVKEKEAKFLHERLTRSVMPDSLKPIPEKDRSEFIQAYEHNDKKYAYAVLDRPSFAEHDGKEPRAIASVESTAGKEAVKKDVLAAVNTTDAKNEKPKADAPLMSTVKLDSKLLDGLRDAQSAPSTPPTECPVPPGSKGHAKDA